jgi:hypothetical protein
MSVLKLSTDWQFSSVRKSVIEELLPYTRDDPILKIIAAKKFDILNWLLPGINTLAQRKEPLCNADIQRFQGAFEEPSEVMNLVLNIATVRETWTGQLKVSPLQDVSQSPDPASCIMWHLCPYHDVSTQCAGVLGGTSIRADHDFTDAICAVFGSHLTIKSVNDDETTISTAHGSVKTEEASQSMLNEVVHLKADEEERKRKAAEEQTSREIAEEKKRELLVAEAREAARLKTEAESAEYNRKFQEDSNRQMAEAEECKRKQEDEALMRKRQREEEETARKEKKAAQVAERKRKQDEKAAERKRQQQEEKDRKAVAEAEKKRKQQEETERRRRLEEDKERRARLEAAEGAERARLAEEKKQAEETRVAEAARLVGKRLAEEAEAKYLAQEKLKEVKETERLLKKDEARLQALEDPPGALPLSSRKPVTLGAEDQARVDAAMADLGVAGALFASAYANAKALKQAAEVDEHAAVKAEAEANTGPIQRTRANIKRRKACASAKAAAPLLQALVEAEAKHADAQKALECLRASLALVTVAATEEASPKEGSLLKLPMTVDLLSP